MRAADLLTPYSFNSLRTVARTRGLRFDGLRRVELVEVLADSLFEPADLTRVIAGLREQERAVLVELSRFGGRASSQSLVEAAAGYGVDPAISHRPRESLDRIAPDTHRFDEICAKLTANGLLFSESEERGPLVAPLNLNPGSTLIIPGAVLQALAAEAAASAPPEIARVLLADGGSAWTEDLRAYSALISRQWLIVDPGTGLLAPPSLKQVLEAFKTDGASQDESSFSRLWLLRRLLTALGIARLRGARLVLHRMDFFEHDRPERAALLLAAYRQEREWVELHDLQPGTAAVWRGHVMTSLLDQADPGWSPIQPALPPDLPEGLWEAFTASALLGPLRWFGLVDLELADDCVTRARWTDLGLFVAGKAPRPETIRGRLIVQPSFSILLLPPFDDATLARLDAIAERVRTGETVEWRLSQPRWHAAVEQGYSPAELEEWLIARGEAALPQNVSYTLAEWTRLGEQAVLHEEAAVILGPPEEIDRLAAASELGLLIILRVAPDRLVLRDGAAVEEALSAMGMPPLVQRYDRPSPGASIAIAEDGVISLGRAGIGSIRNLLLPIALEQFCRPIDEGRYQIDQERLRQAVAQSPDGVTGILQLLRAHAQSLPPALITRLKILGQSAAIALDRPVLLRLAADELDILRADPELAPFLGREYAPDDKLIELSDGDTGLLRALLGKRGIWI